MRLTKNTRLGKKPYKANNGYAAYDPTTFDPNKQISLNEQEFGVTPSSVQTPNTGVAPQGGQSALRLEGAKTTPDLSGQKIDFSKSSSGSSSKGALLSAASDVGVAGMAMGVGAIEKQQSELAAVNKAPSLSGEMGKGALKGASMVTPAAVSLAGVTGGLSLLAIPAAAAGGAAVNYITGNKKIKEFNTQMDAKKSLARQALTNRTNLSSQYNQADAVNRGYSAQGSNMSSFYGKNGGKMKCDNGAIISKDGGFLKSVSSDTKLAYGNTHEQGGILMSENAEIEGGGVTRDGKKLPGETVVDKGDHTLVVSDNLVNPKTGRTFAKDDLRLAKLARKYEGASTQLAKNSLKHIQAKREELHDLQQQMNGDASDMDTAKNGGKMRPINVLTKPNPTNGKPATHFAKDGMKLYGGGGKDYYADYKKGEADLGGGYKVKRGADGKVQYSKDNGKTYSRPDKATYDKLNSTAFKGKLGKDTETPIDKVDNTRVRQDDKDQLRYNGNSDEPLQDDFLKRKTPQAGHPSVNAGKTALDERVESGDLYKENLHKSTNTNKSPDAPENKTPSTDKDYDWSKFKRAGQAMLPGLSRAGKLASYAAPGLAQYYANKADIARQEGMDIPEYKKQRFEVLAKQSKEVDRTAIIKQQADYNAGVTGTLADSQTAALMKANMASKAGDALVKINQDERNANIETANRQTQLNLGIDAANKEGEYEQAYSQLAKDIDLSRRKARNVAELSANMQQVQDVDRREKWADADTLVKVAGLDERGINYLDGIGANPAGHYTGRKLLISRNGGKLTKLRR